MGIHEPARPPTTRLQKLEWRLRWWRAKYLGVVGYLIFAVVVAFTLHRQDNVVHQQAKDRDSARVQSCQTTKDTRDVVAETVTQAIAASRPTPQLDAFIATVNARLARYPTYCQDVIADRPLVRAPVPVSPTIPARP